MSKAIPFRGEAEVTIGGEKTTLRLSIAEIEAIEARDSRGLLGMFMSLATLETQKLTDAVFVIGQGMIGAGDKKGADRARDLAATAPLNELTVAACTLLKAQFKTEADGGQGNAPAAKDAAA